MAYQESTKYYYMSWIVFGVLVFLCMGCGRSNSQKGYSSIEERDAAIASEDAFEAREQAEFDKYRGFVGVTIALWDKRERRKEAQRKIDAAFPVKARERREERARRAAATAARMQKIRNSTPDTPVDEAMLLMIEAMDAEIESVKDMMEASQTTRDSKP